MDIMLDIESLGVRQNAKVTQIAAVAFDPMTATTPATTFNQYVRLEFQDERTIDIDTLIFWAEQPDNLYHKMLTRCRDGLPPVATMKRLKNFCKEVEPERIWANGITFDLSVLQNLGDEVGVPVFWQEGSGYRLPRCMRGLKDIAYQMDPNYPLHDLVMNWLQFKGQAHDALYDCFYQARAVQLLYRKIGLAV